MILVFGVVFWLGTQWQNLTPLLKVAVGYAVGGGLLATGILLEKRWNYALLGRTTAGGGWALLYFTTYAMHHLAATRVIESQSVDLVLLLVVAAAMVAHTLRYDSQTATAVAFLLGFATVTFSRDTVYSLSASAVLAAALVVIVLLRRWYELEVFGLLASYLNHFLWLRTIIEPMGSRRHDFPELIPSMLLLFFYWAAFRVSYLVRRAPSKDEENVSTVAALLNIGLLLGLLKYQSVHPELAFWALLGLGAAELAFGQLPRLRVQRRQGFVALTTVGLSLLIAAFPFRYSGSNLSVLWLVEGEALFIVGVVMREAIFRYFGLLAAVLTSGHMLAVDGWRVLEARSAGPGEPPEYRVAVLFAVAALIFYANSHWVFRRWNAVFGAGREEVCVTFLSYLAGLLAAVGAWLAFPGAWTAVAWTALALLLAAGGSRLRETPLTVQADVCVVGANVWVLANNLDAAGKFHGVTLRLITMAASSLLLYAAAHWRSRTAIELSSQFSAGYTWVGTILLSILAWKELPGHWVPVAWAAFGLVLLVISRVRGRGELGWQAHCLAVIAVFGAMTWGLDATALYHGLTLRLLSISAVAGLIYLSTLWIPREKDDLARAINAAYTWMGTILLALLAEQELPGHWVPVVWAAFGVLLLVLGRVWKRRALAWQAHCLAVVALAGTAYWNFSATTLFHGMTLRLLSVTAVAGLLYLSTLWIPKEENEYSFYIHAAYSWAASGLVTTLMWYELRPVSVALGWTIFGLLVFELGWLRRSASLRLQGYTAFLAAFLRMFYVNLNAESLPGELSARLYSILPLAAAFYYVSWRVARSPEADEALERQFQASRWHNYLGVISAAALVRFELNPDWAAAGWAAMVLVLMVLASRFGNAVFLHQGLLLSFAVLFRTVFYNFELPKYSEPAFWHRPMLAVGAACGLLLLSLPFAFGVREKQGAGPAPPRFGPVRRPEQVLFFVPMALMTVLLALEMRKGLITLAWGIEGLLVFLLALWVGERSFRLTGLGLLLLCVGKIGIVDVWSLEKSDRYLTFIALGAALLLVSFLYNRFQASLRQYL